MFNDWAVINASWTEGLCDVLMTAVSQMNNCQCFPSVSSGLWWERLWQQVKTLFSSLLLNVSLPPSVSVASQSELRLVSRGVNVGVCLEVEHAHLIMTRKLYRRWVDTREELHVLMCVSWLHFIVWLSLILYLVNYWRMIDDRWWWWVIDSSFSVLQYDE